MLQRNYQNTIKNKIKIEGSGVHSLDPSILHIEPARANQGVIFCHIDEFGNKTTIPALPSSVYKTNLCTGLRSPSHPQNFIDTVEHLLSAVSACDLDNLTISLKGNEIPILDGSADIFYDILQQAGIKQQSDAKREYIKITKPIRVESKKGFAEIIPYDGVLFDVTIDFPDVKVIGKQRMVFDLEHEDYKALIASARTFGFIKDIELLWSKGMAMSSDFKNSVIMDSQGDVVNNNGLRFSDEFVRHKLLDAVGDMFLLGRRFIGKFRSYAGGHSLNHQLCEAIYSENFAKVVYS